MRDRTPIHLFLAVLVPLAVASAARDALAIPPPPVPPIESGGSLVGSATGAPAFEQILNSPSHSTLFSAVANDPAVNAESEVQAAGGSVPIVRAFAAADDADTSLDFGAHATTTASLDYYFYIGPSGAGPPIVRGTLVPIAFTDQMDVSPFANVLTDDATARGSASLIVQDPSNAQTYFQDEIQADWIAGPATASSGGLTPLQVPFDTYLIVSLFVTAEAAVAPVAATSAPTLHAFVTARIDPSIAIDPGYEYADQLVVVQTTVPEPTPELGGAAAALVLIARRRGAR
jgi:hypothetical protein